MQGKKHYKERLFINFQLSDHIPEDNFYRRLYEAVDFSFLYKKTSSYYGFEGQKSIDPVVFIKMMLIGYLENLNSDRRIVDTVSMRMDMRFFIGYDIDEDIPWHSTLSRTRQLYGEAVFKEVFELILNQCVEKGMVSGRLQAIDSVFVKANASLDKMVEREISDYIGQLDRNAADTKPVVKNITEKVHKKGLPAPKNPGNKTHFSPSDPDSKMSVKPGKPTALNYLGQVSVDTASHVITHIEAFTADKRDSACLAPVLKGIIGNFKQNGLILEEIVADTGFSSGEALKALEQNNIIGYIPNRSQFIPNRPGFEYDQKGDCYICPHNQKLTYKGTFQTLPGVFNKHYAIDKKRCNECPFNSKCTIVKKKGSIITETIDKPFYMRMHERMQTERAKRLMKKRQSTVEPVIGTLVNYLGMKKVNTKGLKQANKCMLMSATAYNIKKLLKHIPLFVQTLSAKMTKTTKPVFETPQFIMQSICV